MRLLSVAAFVLFTLTASARAEEAKSAAPVKSNRLLKIGAVAYGPSAVTVFQRMKLYFEKAKMPMDFVLYSNYDALVQALRDGHVDIAWNTPLAHAQYHLLAGGQSQTLVMRDADCNYRCKLLVRKDADINTLDDLKGKTLVLGSRWAAEATVLPIYYLKKEGVSLDQVKVLSLDKEMDLRGNPCCSPSHVLKALSQGRAQAGVIGEQMWKKLVADKAPEADSLKEIWTSPPFSHCVFTANKDFDKKLGERFAKLMLAMDGKDPVTAEILELEAAKKWVPGTQEGFEDLLKALREEQKVASGKSE